MVTEQYQDLDPQKAGPCIENVAKEYADYSPSNLKRLRITRIIQNPCSWHQIRVIRSRMRDTEGVGTFYVRIRSSISMRVSG